MLVLADMAKKIVSTSGTAFVIETANYVIRDEAGATLEQGAAFISEDVVFVLFDSEQFPADMIYSVVFEVTIQGMPKKLVEPIFFKVKQK